MQQKVTLSTFILLVIVSRVFAQDLLDTNCNSWSTFVSQYHRMAEGKGSDYTTWAVTAPCAGSYLQLNSGYSSSNIKTVFSYPYAFRNYQFKAGAKYYIELVFVDLAGAGSGVLDITASNGFPSALGEFPTDRIVLTKLLDEPGDKVQAIFIPKKDYSTLYISYAGFQPTRSTLWLKSITIDENPCGSTRTISGNVLSCDNTPATLTPPTGILHHWETPYGTRQTSSVTANTVGTYTVYTLTASKCIDSASTVVNAFKPSPTKPIITSDGPSTYCQDAESRTLTSTPAYSYQWQSKFSANPWSNILGQTGQSYTIAPGTTYTTDHELQIKITSANGCSNYASTKIIKVPRPNSEIKISNLANLCTTGATLQPTETSSLGNTYTFQWSTGSQSNSILVNAPGTYSVNVTKTYAGLEPDVTCSNTSSHTIQDTRQNQTITFNPIPPNTLGTPPFQLTATASSGLPVKYSSSNTAVATISGNTVTIIGEGTTVIAASQPGNGCYFAAPIKYQPLVITKKEQPISFNFPAEVCKNSTYELIASAPSGNPVTFTSSNTLIAVVSGNVLRIIGEGAFNIHANVVGSSVYKPGTTALPCSTVKASIQGATTLCENTTTKLIASTGASYLWSTGATTQSVFVGEGLHSVTIQYNILGTTCQSSAGVRVFQSLTQGSIMAFGSLCDGPVELQAGDGSNYEWSTGETSKSIWVHSAGSYQVSYLGPAGCVLFASVTVPSPQSPDCRIIEVPFAYAREEGGVSLTVFPNPASTSVTVQLRTPAPEPVPVFVVDLLGKAVTEVYIDKGQQSKEIDTRSFANGLYVVRVGTKYSVSGKLKVER